MKKWSAEEKQLLKKGYDAGLSAEEIAPYLPERSVAAIVQKSTEMSIPLKCFYRARVEYCTEKEKADLLAAFKESVSAEERNDCGDTFREFSVAISGTQWTESEDAILRNCCDEGVCRNEMLNRLPNKTLYAINKRLAAWGISKSRAVWTREEDDILQHCLVEEMSIRKISECIPGKTPSMIAYRVQKLGISTL